MKVVISGGSGLIGTAIARVLVDSAEVLVLSRRPEAVMVGQGVLWDPASRGDWTSVVRDADIVVNLAGAGIGDKRWSERRKKELWDSRIVSTRAIVDALGARSIAGQPVLISASAVGYYGARGDEELDESSGPGEGFLCRLSEAWENEAKRACDRARVVIPRIGIVLARNGGALAAMMPIFRMGLGGPLGSGRQWMSWIHLDDLVALIREAISDERFEGPINAVAPSPVTNREFTKSLGQALHRPAILPAPGFAVRLALGEMADALLLTGQRVRPRAASKLGFEFGFENLASALDALSLRS